MFVIELLVTKEGAMPGILAQLRILARHTVTQHSGWYPILRDPKVRELLREVCREVETSDGEMS